MHVLSYLLASYEGVLWDTQYSSKKVVGSLLIQALYIFWPTRDGQYRGNS